VTKHAALTGAIGVVIVAALLIPGVQLNPSESQAKGRPVAATRSRGAPRFASAGISAGVYKPFDILVEGAVTKPALEKIATEVGRTPGVAGLSRRASWAARFTQRSVEAIFGRRRRGAATKKTISRLQNDVLPKLADETSLKVTLGGQCGRGPGFRAPRCTATSRTSCSSS